MPSSVQALYDCPFSNVFLNGSYDEYRKTVYSYRDYSIVFGTIKEHFLSSIKFLNNNELNPFCWSKNNILQGSYDKLWDYINSVRSQNSLNIINPPIILCLRDIHQFYNENKVLILLSNHRDDIVFLMDFTNNLLYNYQTKSLRFFDSFLEVSYDRHKNIGFCSIDGSNSVELSKIIYRCYWWSFSC